MKILHVIDSMNKGGAERNLANLFGPLTELGIENHLATLWPGCAYPERVAQQVHRARFGLWQDGPVSGTRALAAMARDVDVVHTHLITSDIAGRLAGVAARRPILSTLHSTWYAHRSITLLPPTVRVKAQTVRLIDACSARAVRHFFAVSAAVREAYLRALYLRPERVEVMPNAVDLREFDPSRFSQRQEARARLGLGAADFGILVVGRFVDQKDHVTAIRAVAELARRLPARLLLAGSGPKEAILRRLVAEAGAPVTFLGVRDDVPHLLFAADLFLYPTFFEGMSVALMEAMAMAKPCLCSDIPENRQVAQDAAVYVAPGNPAALASALQTLAADRRQRDRLAIRARDLSAGFDAYTVAQRLVRSMSRVI